MSWTVGEGQEDRGAGYRRQPENSMQGEHVEGEGASHLHSGFQDIIKEIHSLKAKFRTDFAPLNKDIKQEMKEEFQTLI